MTDWQKQGGQRFLFWKKRTKKLFCLQVSSDRPACTQAVRGACGAGIAALFLSGCSFGVLDPKGAIGIADKTILVDSLIIMLAIVVPTIMATLGFAWWFRASNPRARRLPNFAYSGHIELIVWSIPLLTIMLLGGVAWIGAHELDPARELPSSIKPLDIQAVSLDWKWLFIYPQQHIATVNLLVVPVNTPLRFELTSDGVMNAFFIPQLGSMIYTMNGMTTHLNLDAEVPGDFRGLSSHFSGDGFAGMHFNVHAIPASQFAGWVANVQSAGQVLDASSYNLLTRQSMNVAPFTYRAASPSLFDDIVSQELPPGPGPKTGRPDPIVTPKSEQ